MGRPKGSTTYIDRYPCNLCGKLFKRQNKYQRFCACKHSNPAYRAYHPNFNMTKDMVSLAHKPKRRGHE